MLAVRGRGRDGDVDVDGPEPERIVYSPLGIFSYATFPLLVAVIALRSQEVDSAPVHLGTY